MFIERQGDGKANTSTVGTNTLGPCICFVLDFTHGIQQKCIMHHYAFHQDEEDKSRLEIVEWLLQFIRDLLMDFVDMQSTSADFNVQNIKHMFLVMIGGDVYEGAAIRKACSDVYDNLIDLDQNGPTDSCLWYIYRELKHRIVLINSVIEIPPLSNELSDEIVIHDDCYQSLWINYDTELKVASLGVYWCLSSGKFNLTLSNLEVMPTTTCQSKWVLQQVQIENFKEICTSEQREELHKMVSLIPIDMVSHSSKSLI